MEYQPIAPERTSSRLKRRLVGVALAIGSAIALLLIKDAVPGGVRFPVIILALPALAVAAGLFQALTGLTLFQVNAELPFMPKGRQVIIVTTLIILLVGVLGAFTWLLIQ